MLRMNMHNPYAVARTIDNYFSIRQQPVNGLHEARKLLCRAVLFSNDQANSGSAASLGATPGNDGVSFAVHSREAHAVDLCLFDPARPMRETGRVRLKCDENDTWRGFVPGLKAGALYGFRAHGAWEPAQGRWFNARKLLLDPYAKAVA